jgi:RHS repeat-associated protein
VFKDRNNQNPSSSKGPASNARSGETETSRSSSSGNSMPAISLPKGGGAIRGIGEKFAANPVTGTGTLTIPIAISPGRSGFGPELSLSYDSGSGNGPFGFGWKLSLPAITRKTDKGLPRYWDSEESDVFILSGAEDLVPVLIESNGDWQREGLPTRVLDGENYRIQRYRPRIEGLFARVERWTNLQTGETHWRSITRDNVTNLYGKDDNSRIFSPADANHPRREFSWLICQSHDDKGNAIVYEYAAENDQNVNQTQVNERNRSRQANRYLKRINYGNRVSHLVQPNPSQMQWMFEVVLDYEEGHYDEVPLNPLLNESEQERFILASSFAAMPWAVRPDPFSSYRAGFEVRTYRRCRRVMMFHHFDELALNPCLVRSTQLEYADFDYSTPAGIAEQLTHQGSSRFGSFVRSITQSGYTRDDSKAVVDRNGVQYVTYSKKSLPPLEFAYSQAIIQEDVRELDDRSLENLPVGIDGGTYQWVDLEGEGISGILTDQADGWFYKPNLGNGRFGPLEVVASKPSLANLGGGVQQLIDLAGNGQLDLVTFAGPSPGYYERTQDENWVSYRTFRSLPNVRWDDPNLRFVDLTGDGHADLLITEDDVFTWYPSLAEEGFDSSGYVRKPLDEERGPQLVLADGTQSIYLADMCGDGLTALVRIRNAEVCYWPNLGYGRFGAKVTMDDSPVFDNPDQFENARVRVADIDGSGTNDIIYLSREGARVYFNQAGNRWSKPRLLSRFPHVDELASVMTVDLLGNGTACLVWSSPLPADKRSPVRYIDLMGGQKPHLLASIKNNLGAETRVQYAASTKFYLEDQAVGVPWVTRLPFPVHVVERLETFDFISRTSFATTYSYRHGYFDGEEREFRGFGYVEQRDSESFSRYSGRGLFTEQPRVEGEEFHLPPVVTKTWFHNGAWFDQERISTQYASEYFSGDPQAVTLPDTILPGLATAEDEREACRALKGSILRQEVYAEDGSANAGVPYSVSERNYALNQCQPREQNRHSVFFAYPLETIDYHYERNVTDPRIGHTTTLEVDDFGNVLKSVATAYPRRTALHPEQSITPITFTESRFINEPNDQPGDPDWRRIGLAFETLTSEITGVTPVADVFTRTEINNAIASAAEMPYEETTGSGTQRRLIERVRSLFWKDDLSGAAPLGQIESRALPFEGYKQAFTPGLIAQVFGSRVDDALLSDEGKYVQFDGVWWIPSGQTLFETQPVNSDRDPFYLPIAFKDPFDNITRTTYDSYSLLVTGTTDALGNQITAENDYRVLQPALTTDPNGNRAAVAFDELGMVVATAVMGKTNAGEGDTLADPTTKLEYDLFNWINHGRPSFVHTFAREQHGPANPRWQESYSYSDGSGREVLKKVQAEPGFAPQRDSSGGLVRDALGHFVLSDTAPVVRWVGTGRTVLDNKGNPIKKYEPFFDSSPAFNDEHELVEWGVTPILRYDPLGRLIRTDNPNGTLSRVEFDPWQQLTFDENDTVLASQWYADRQNLPVTNPERRAADAAALHADTPSVVHLDTLGRTFLTVTDNGAAGTFETRVALDIEGNQRSVTDARHRQIFTQGFDMLGTVIHSLSVDAGERWMLNDAAGKPVRRWDSRDHMIRTTYDALQRPSHLFVSESSNPEVLVERSVHGEAHPNAEGLNLRGKVFQHYDGAGVVTNERYDFKGNLINGSRQLAVEYKEQVDWAPLATLTDAQAIAAPPSALIETETFSTATEYDAVNRPTRLTTPDQSQIKPMYNEANLFERVDVNLRGAIQSTSFVAGVDYDAKGQRLQIDYGNGATTSYEYDEETFRLTRLRTVRASDSAQLQDLSYTYDPIGNIISIRDDAQQPVYFHNQVVTASAEYQYDAIYRLINATGREHLGQTNGQLNAPQQPTDDDSFRTNLLHRGDSNAMGNYAESYQYDEVGNILKMIHTAQGFVGGGWTRNYQYDPASNRLLLTSNPSGSLTDAYVHDAHGNMIQMRHLPLMQWDFKDQLHATSRQVVTSGTPETTWYVYDSGGQRVRKVTDNSATAAAGQTPTRKAERIYLGGYEVYREYGSNGSMVTLERESLHIMDDKQRIALVETKTKEANTFAGTLPDTLIRYQFSNHLGSASVELDDQAKLISYEEYFPYGNTSYQAVRSKTETAKRYRYTGMERDEESGFGYHGARYYAAWLGRWVGCDPIGLKDGLNLFQYCSNNPIRLRDMNGMQAEGADERPKNPQQGDIWEHKTEGGTFLWQYDAKEGWVGQGGVVTLPDAVIVADSGPIVAAPDNTRVARRNFQELSPSQLQPVISTSNSNQETASSTQHGVGVFFDDFLNMAGVSTDAAETVAEQMAQKYVVGSNDAFYIKSGPGRFRGNQHVKITNQLSAASETVGKIGKGVNYLQILKDAYDIQAAETPEEGRKALVKGVIDIALTRVNPAISLTIGFGQLVMSTDEFARTRIRDIDAKLEQLKQKWQGDPIGLLLDPQWEELHDQRSEMWERLHPSPKRNGPPQLYFRQGK